MERFILGRNAAFDDLKRRSLGRCLRFSKVELPPGADPRFAAVGFQTDLQTGQSVLYVDRGAYHGPNNEIAAWIKAGQRRFPSFANLKTWVQETLPSAYFCCASCGSSIDLASTQCNRCGSRSTFSPFVERVIEQIRAAVDRDPGSITGCVSEASLADRLQLPRTLVRSAAALMVLRDQRFLLTHDGTEILIFCNPLEHDVSSHGMLARFQNAVSGHSRQRRQLLKLAHLRARLSHRADTVQMHLCNLHNIENDLLGDGRRTQSIIIRRELARRIHRVRRDIAHLSMKASMINRQIDVLAAHLHHLLIADDTRRVNLPSADELSQHSVQAEQAIEETNELFQLSMDSDQSTRSPESDVDTTAILKEMEEILTTPAVLEPQTFRDMTEQDIEQPDQPSRLPAD